MSTHNVGTWQSLKLMSGPAAAMLAAMLAVEVRDMSAARAGGCMGARE